MNNDQKFGEVLTKSLEQLDSGEYDKDTLALKLDLFKVQNVRLKNRLKYKELMNSDDEIDFYKNTEKKK